MPEDSKEQHRKKVGCSKEGGSERAREVTTREQGAGERARTKKRKKGE